MSVRAARGDGEITKPKRQWQRGGTEQGFHLLSSSSTATPGLQAGTGGSRLREQRFITKFWQKLQRQWTLNNVSSEDTTPMGVGGDNSHTWISPSSCTGVQTEAVPHLLSSALTR